MTSMSNNCKDNEIYSLFYPPQLKNVKFNKYHARHRTGGVGRMFQS